MYANQPVGEGHQVIKQFVQYNGQPNGGKQYKNS